MSRRLRFAVSSAKLLALAALILFVAACERDKTDKILVQNVVDQQANRPPTIVAQGPTLPPGGFEQVSYYQPQGVDLWVLVGDPDGIDDISLVTVDVGSVEVLRFIVRPDTSTTGCSKFSYASGDTISADAILPVPATFPGLSFRPLIQRQGGLFVISEFGGSGVGFPNLLAASTLLESWNGGCYNAPPYWVFGPIVVLPPVVPSKLTAIISYADVRYHGISVTVHDATGASASSSFPDWRIVFTSPEEKAAAP